MSSSASSQNQSITISYSISPPSSYTGSLPVQSTLAIPIPASSYTTLSSSIQSARDACNTLLTQWKDEIGESEKAKEVEAAKRAEEKRQRIKDELKSSAAAKGEEEGSDGSEEEGDEEE